jgi:hypothetical protein
MHPFLFRSVTLPLPLSLTPSLLSFLHPNQNPIINPKKLPNPACLKLLASSPARDPLVELGPAAPVEPPAKGPRVMVTPTPVEDKMEDKEEMTSSPSDGRRAVDVTDPVTVGGGWVSRP